MQHHFIGISSSVKAAQKASTFQKELKLEQYYKVLPSLEDFHITLLFLGGWERGKKVQLWNQIKKLSFPSFTLTFKSYSFFGSQDRPRVLFLQPEKSEALQHLYDMILQEALKLDYPAPKSSFRPHITVAKKFRSAEIFPYTPYGNIDPVKLHVEKVSLFQVQPQEHPKYQEQEAILLYQD